MCSVQSFGQRSQAHSVTFGDGSVQGQELDLMVPVSPFQLRILYDSEGELFPAQSWMCVESGCSSPDLHG